MISKPRLVALLKRLEWVPMGYHKACPWCGREESTGRHRVDCELAACLEGLAHLLPPAAPPAEETSSR